MPRPRTNPTSADIDDEIARLTREQEQRIAALTERRRQAESAENLRRGQLVQSYLDGPHGAEIRRSLAPVVGPRDRSLFGIADDDGADNATDTRPVTGRRMEQARGAVEPEPVPNGDSA